MSSFASVNLLEVEDSVGERAAGVEGRFGRKHLDSGLAGSCSTTRFRTSVSGTSSASHPRSSVHSRPGPTASTSSPWAAPSPRVATVSWAPPTGPTRSRRSRRPRTRGSRPRAPAPSSRSCGWNARLLPQQGVLNRPCFTAATSEASERWLERSGIVATTSATCAITRRFVSDGPPIKARRRRSITG